MLGLAGISLGGTRVKAQTAVVWNATTAGAWGTGSNWASGSVPANSLTTNYAHFSNATGVIVTAATTQSVAGIEFGSTSGAYTLRNASGGGRTITVGSYGIRSSSAADQLFTGSKLTLTLGAASTFRVDGTGDLTISSTGGSIGTTATNTLTLGGTGAGLGTVSSVISGAGTLTKQDSGTWTLSGANTYTGTTSIAAGTLSVSTINSVSGGSNSSNLGAPATVAKGTIHLGGGTTTGTLLYTGAGETTDRVIDLAGTTGGGVINAAGTGALTFSSALTATGAGSKSLTLTGTNTGANTFAGAIVDNSGVNTTSVIKAGSGNWTVSGTSTYTGGTVVSQGTLTASGSSALGATTSSVAVNSGATLAIAGGTTITKTATLSLDGTGASGATGALHASGGTGTTSRWAGNLTLSSSATATAADNLLIVGDGTGFTNTLGLGGNTLTLHTPSAATVTPVYEPFPAYMLDAANIVINTKITGTGGISKTGTGTVTLLAGSTGGNAFTGDTVVTGGKLILDGYNNTPAINSANVYVGNSSASPGTADSVVLQVGQLANSSGPQNAIGTWNASTNASTSNVTIYADGVFKMNNANTGLANLTLQGGHVDSGNIINNPLLTLTGSVTTNASSRTALINNGNVAMSANSFTFTVASGTTASGIDLQIDSILQNGVGYTGGSAGTSLVKTGTGQMAFTNLNTYSGITNISAGILNIQHGSALGQTGTFQGDTANGTIVQSGAQLQLQGGITVGSFESLTLSGSGVSTSGALRNLNGNNTYNGFIYLAGDSRINADTGTTLTIANTSGVNSTIINGTAAGRNLTIGGAGNTVVSGGISSFVNHVAKEDSGTLTLAGANSYAGTTSVSAGAVKVTHGSGLAGSGVVVSDGAALHFAQDGSGNNISVVGVGATINGSGLSSGGAIQNLSGSNTYAGLVTLGSDSLITANSGTSLTLSGGIGTAAQGLIVGTAANNGNITVSGNVSGGGSLTKAGTGTLTFSGASTTFGVVNMNAGTLAFTGAAVTTGAVHLNAGTLSVSGSTTANTGAIDAVAGTTLTIASGGSIVANYAAGTTTFSGTLAGGGEFQKDGAGTLVFNNTFTASNLTLTLNGGTLSLLGGQFTFGTIHITGNTVLDFNNSAGTFLSSTNLIIDAGVTVTVNNWTSVANNAALSTVWYATNTINGGTLGGTSQVGGTPLNQIGFTNYNGLTGTWVSGTPNGWFSHEIRPTPEPSTYGLILVAGCVGVIGIRRYRRNCKSAA